MDGKLTAQESAVAVIGLGVASLLKREARKVTTEKTLEVSRGIIQAGLQSGILRRVLNECRTEKYEEKPPSPAVEGGPVTARSC